MPFWIHVIAVVAICIYSIYSFIKQKKGFHILIIIWALMTLLKYASSDPIFIRVLGIVQIVMFIVVVFLMFRRRGERRMSTLQMLSKMSADSVYNDEKTDNVTVKPTEIGVPSADITADTADNK